LLILAPLAVETNLSNIKLAIKIYQRKRSKRSFFRFTDGADFGRIFPGAEISADFTSPYRQGQMDKLAFCFTFFLFSGGGRRSGIDDISCFPLATASAT